MNDLGGTGAGTGGSRAVVDAVVGAITAAGGEAVANDDSVATEEGGSGSSKPGWPPLGRWTSCLTTREMCGIKALPK